MDTQFLRNLNNIVMSPQEGLADNSKLPKQPDTNGKGPRQV